DFTQQSDRTRLVRVDQPGRENKVLTTGRSQQGHQPNIVRNRQAVAQGTTDRKAEPGSCGCDAKVATSSDTGTGTRACPSDGCDRRNWATLQSAERAIDPRFVFQGVVLRRDGTELRNIRSGGERLLSRACQHEDANGRI